MRDKFKQNLINQRFGMLTVIGQGRERVRVKGNSKWVYYGWVCECDCGEKLDVDHYKLLSGHSKSCGCYRDKKCGDQFRTHGKTNTKEHRAWKAMIGRCHNQNNAKFPIYGARGIEVCKEWRESFEAFLAHIGLAPNKNASVDRIDVNKGYSPGNVRWASAKEQSMNRRKTLRFELNGELKTVEELTLISGIKRGTILYRIKCGLSVHEAITKKIKTKGNKHELV